MTTLVSRSIEFQQLKAEIAGLTYTVSRISAKLYRQSFGTESERLDPENKIKAADLLDLTSSASKIASLTISTMTDLGPGVKTGRFGLLSEAGALLLKVMDDIEAGGLGNVKIGDALSAAGIVLDTSSIVLRATPVGPAFALGGAGASVFLSWGKNLAGERTLAELGWGIGSNAIPQEAIVKVVSTRQYETDGRKIIVIETLDSSTGLKTFDQFDPKFDTVTTVAQKLNGKFDLKINGKLISESMEFNVLSRSFLKDKFGEPVPVSGPSNRSFIRMGESISSEDIVPGLVEINSLSESASGIADEANRLFSGNNVLGQAQLAAKIENELAGRDLSAAIAIYDPANGFTIQLNNGDQFSFNQLGQVASVITTLVGNVTVVDSKNFDGTSSTLRQLPNGVFDTTNRSASGLVTTRLVEEQVGRDFAIRVYGPDDTFLGSKIRVARNDGVREELTLNANQVLVERREFFTERLSDGTERSVLRITDPVSGVIVSRRPNADGTFNEKLDDYSVTSQRAASSVVDFLSGASSAYSQWKSGNKIPAFVTIGGATVRVIGGLNPSTIESMQGVGAAFAGVGSALAIDAQFSRSGNELGKATALANGLNTFNTTVYRSFGTNVTTTSVAFNGLDTILNGAGAAQGVGGLINSQLPGVLPVLGVFNGIKNKDPFATIQGIIGIVNPALLATPLGWVLLAASLIYSFSKEPPKGWGEAKFVYSFDGQELDVNAVGESFGLSKVRDAMKGSFSTDAAGVQHYSAGLKDYLYAMINRTVDTDAQAANLNNAMNAPVVLNPDAKVGIIAQRMPTLNYSEARYGNLVGYRLNEVDPLTGQQLRAGLRWDDNWSAYNATMGNATEQENLMQAMIRAALTRGAIAPMWEVQTANMQEANGDLNAGLTEEERAARQGLSVVLDAKRKPVGGTFRAIAIDLDGNGSIGRVANANTSVAFNWDDSGYFKQTGWINSNDGFLVLDRNNNGVIDSGKELFSNGYVADDAKGLRSLFWVDADGNSKINAADPVFNELKIWHDADGDGKAGLDELTTLAANGITEIDYGAVRVSRNGQFTRIETVALEAEATGENRVFVGNGYRIETSNGNAELQLINFGTAVQTHSDGLGFFAAKEEVFVEEDAKGLVLTREFLLSNDVGLGGVTEGIEITGIGTQEHCLAMYDANEKKVRITLEQDFNGVAKFSYLLNAPNGSTLTIPVTINVDAIDDAPRITIQWDASQKVHGFDVLSATVFDGNGTGSLNLLPGEGRPIYGDYQSIAGRKLLGAVDANGIPFTEDVLVDSAISLDRLKKLVGLTDEQWAAQTDPNLKYDLTLDGFQWELYPNKPRFSHNTVLYEQQALSGTIVAIDPEDPTAKFEYLVEEPTNSSKTGIELDKATGHFVYRPTRWVGNDDTGAVINANVGYDKDKGDLGALYIRSESVLDPQANYDFFKIRLLATDADGNKYNPIPQPDANGVDNTTINLPQYGPKAVDVKSGAKKPIAIDLNNDGFHFTDVDDSNVFFAVNETGWRRRMAWNNPDDGLIAYDKNGDGKIDRYDEISFVPYLEGAGTDLEGLAAFDTNKDGVFSALDAEWNKFGVWKDSNSNGINEAGEFVGFASHNITSISLTSNNNFQVINGQTVHGTATAGLANGGTLAIADVSFNYKNQTQIQNADGTTQIVDLAGLSIGDSYIGNEDKDISFGGQGNDSHQLGGGDDYILDDLGDDEVDAGTGDDQVYTGSGNDRILGGAGHDKIFSGDGNDVVFGDNETFAGDDFIVLGEGNDVAFGGAGNDLIDGGRGNDVISGDLGNDRLLGADGWDAITGGDGDDEIFGGTGNDLLKGDDGNDLIDGGEGADAMEGGLGNDTYFVDSLGDVATEGANGGVDKVFSSVSFNIEENIENLTLIGTANSTGVGNAGENILIGNDGNNLLKGGAGNDVLDGGKGVDQLFGEAGDDIYLVDDEFDYVAEFSTEGVDLVISTASNYQLTTNIENLTLSGNAAINGKGNNFSNVIRGNDADNHLDGRQGADTLIGGGGNDVYVIDSVADVVVELANQGIDSVESGVNFTLGASLENLRLTGRASIGTGNALDNVMVAEGYYRLGDYVSPNIGQGTTLYGLGGNDVLIGTKFADVLEGGDGDDYLDGRENATANNPGGNYNGGESSVDLLVGGNGNDTYVVDTFDFLDQLVELQDGGIDTVRTSFQWTLAANFENIVLFEAASNPSGFQPNGITGNSLNNILTIEAPNATNGGYVYGHSAYGEEGDDTLISWDGNDTLHGGLGLDTYDAGGGNDSIYDYHDSSVVSAGDGNDLIYAFGSLRGGKGNDQFFANFDPLNRASTYFFDLGDGNDYIFEQDYLYPNSTNADFDEINALTETDSIVFGAGINANMISLSRNQSDLIFRVGVSDEIKVGGWFPDFSRSRIEQVSFADGTVWQNSDLRNVVSEWYQMLPGGGINGGAGINGWSGVDRILGTSGDDYIYAKRGVDHVKGGAGNDFLFAGAETGDIAEGEDGDDNLMGLGLLIGGRGNDKYIVNRGAGLPDADTAQSVTVRYNLGDGNDVIAAGRVSTAENPNFKTYIEFGAGISASDLVFTKQDWGLTISFRGSVGSILVENFFLNAGGLSMLEGLVSAIKFADDTSMSATDILANLYVNHAPIVVLPIPDFRAVGTRAFSTTLPAGVFYDEDLGDVTSLSANLTNGLALPTWLTFNSATGTFTGITSNANAGVYTIQVTGTDLQGASASSVFSLTVANLIVGTTASNVLNGTANADVIEGLAGNDTLDGKAGADTLVGSGGNDTYVINDVLDSVVELASEGTDLVRASVSYTLSANVENLTITGTSAVNATGNELANQLTGNAAVNTLYGLDGNDKLISIGDNDVLVGGLGNDSYTLSGAGDIVVELADEGTDTVSAAFSVALSSNVENLTLTGANAANGTGNSLNNVLNGNNGVNVLAGGDGNDTLRGYDGNDQLLGGDGNDSLDGGLGADQMLGGKGNDTYYVGQAADNIVELVDEGTDIVRAAISYVLTSNVENLIMVGAVATTGTGNELANTLTGDAFNNTLYGLGGNDILDGKAGDDVLTGGDGNDIYYVDSVSDVVIESVNQGIDTVVSYVNWTLADNIENLTLSGTAAINGTGNSLANVINGNASANELYGLDGDDILKGGTSDDLLSGGDGADKLYGTQGIDILFSGMGADLLDGGTESDLLFGGDDIDSILGGAGSDFLIGGKGNDTLDGGTQNDVFAFNRGDGQDVFKMGTGTLQSDVLSLGGGILYADLKLSKSGSNLILNLGASSGTAESITLQNWYSDATRKNITKLQMVMASSGGNYDAMSSDQKVNQKIVTFDFIGIVAAFDQARGSLATFSNWSVSNALDTNYQNGSDTQALGGDIAWKYAAQSTLDGVLMPTMRQQMADLGNGVPQLYYQSGGGV